MKKCKHFNLKKFFILHFSFFIAFTATAQNIPDNLLQDSVISTGHIGISIYEPSTNTYWYNYNATKYFVPSSNTKLFTLYAGMKYLGDSLKGIKYDMNIEEGDTVVFIYPTGDPTFLHPDFKKQPVFNFLKKCTYIYIHSVQSETPWGKGWVWDDYLESFMVPRSAFPIYGNLINLKWINKDSVYINPSFFSTGSAIATDLTNGFQLIKGINSNELDFVNGEDKKKEIPFINTFSTTVGLLSDTLKNKHIGSGADYDEAMPSNVSTGYIYSQPTDSLFKPMMHRSDNFFAEQTLLMVSNERLGYMNDEDIIDTLLNNDLKEVPQKPKWVDGSGLSRYDLFTPQDFVYILNKIKDEFGLKRLEMILPTGNEGTLKNYYVKDSSFIYAKTGSMSNHFSISGLLVTKKNKTLIFSILVGDFMGSSTEVKRTIEAFLEDIREKN
jgi:D-alanyl-D-alanine carboxypeptidase/D-alanyl-D-alanine-endopeptidase (penicillin-binding protein 4)